MFMINQWDNLTDTCMPPTVVFRPTLSKGLTAGFAPMPITTCTKKEIRKNLQFLNFLLSLVKSFSNEGGKTFDYVMKSMVLQASINLIKTHTRHNSKKELPTKYVKAN